MPRVGRPTRNARSVTVGTVTTVKPRYLLGAGEGQMTRTSCPPAAARQSSTRQTLVVTPLSVGRNDSVTIAIRTATAHRATVTRVHLPDGATLSAR